MQISSDDKIYIYKMTTDNGGAPCVSDGILSLAICKSQIRSTCEPRNWLVGFGGRSTIGERLIYIAKITQKLSDGRYYRNAQYHSRPDCIYRWDNVNSKYYWEKGKKYHQNGNQLEDDLGKEINNYDKANTLLSNSFIYLGKGGTDAYKKKYKEIKLSIEDLKCGHRLNHKDDLKNELIQLISESPSTNIISFQEPTEPDTNITCNSNEEYLECY